MAKAVAVSLVHAPIDYTSVVEWLGRQTYD